MGGGGRASVSHTISAREIGDFEYALPPELIAQTPVEPRDSSRLLVAHRDTGALEHRVFAEIGDYLRTGDLLVANQSRALPARLRAVKDGSGVLPALLLLAVRGLRRPRPEGGVGGPGRALR